MSAPTDKVAVTITRRERAADGVDIFELADPSGAPLPAWEPGAHIDVVLPAGVRQYSLCGLQDVATWTIGVLREPDGRGGSAWLHDSAGASSRLLVSPPRNHFAFTPVVGEPLLFIAGGVGITALLPMVRAAAAAGADFALHYAGRSRSTMAFLDELSALAGERLVVHAADEGGRLDLAGVVGGSTDATAIYACGPARLLDALEQVAGGHPLHIERFEAREVGAPVLQESFEVELTLTGVTVTVPPDRSILSVAEEAGAFVLSSCQEGTCGTCETPVLEGEVDHRDSILTPAERERMDVMYVCVSRAACPRLVLEL